VEARITGLEKELAVYETQLAAAAIYANAAQLKDTTLKFESVKKELAAQTKRWGELM
jgi:ATP-binding cassette subfamily F protein 3